MSNRKYKNMYKKLKKKENWKTNSISIVNCVWKSELFEHVEYKNIISDFMIKKIRKIK